MSAIFLKPAFNGLLFFLLMVFLLKPVSGSSETSVTLTVFPINSSHKIEKIRKWIAKGDQYFQENRYDSSLVHYLKAFNLADSLSALRSQGTVCLRIRELYQKQHQNEISLIWAKRAESYFKQIAEDSLLATSTRLKGQTYWRLGQFTKALEAYIQAQKMYLALNDSAALGGIYNTIGSIQWFLGNYHLALENFRRSLTLRRALADTDRTVLVLNNIGLVFQELGQWDMARTYHQQALSLARPGNSHFGGTYSKINLGLVLANTGHAEKALVIFESVLPYFEELNDPSETAYIERYIGKAYKELQRYPKALAFYKSTLKNSQQANNNFRIADALLHIGRVYLKMGKPLQAETYAKQCLQLSLNEKYKHLIQSSYNLLAQIGNRQKQFKKAFKYANLASAYKDSVYIEQKSALVNTFQLRLMLEQQEHENENLRARNTLNEVIIFQQKTVQRGMLFGIGIMVAMLGLIVYRWQASRNTNVLLQKQNEEINAINNEKQKLINELQDALENVHQLENLLPICASCKKIRDDKGYWSSVEQYISSRSNIRFSHGLCPDCLKELYPEQFKKIEKRSKS